MASPAWSRGEELFLPGCRILHFPLLNLIGFLCTQLSACPGLAEGSTAFWCVSHSSQLCIISKLAEGALHPFIQLMDGGVKRDRAQYQPHGTQLATGLQPDCATDGNTLSSVSHTVLNPSHCPLIYIALPKLTYKLILPPILQLTFQFSASTQ